MFILIDIGGTNTRLATATSPKSFTSRIKFPTNPVFPQAIASLTKHIPPLLANTQCQGVIVGLPGVMDPSTGQLTSSPNLPGWVNQPVREQIEAIVPAPVQIFNDSDLAGLGEACYGAGQGFEIVAYLTISTGVGGTRIVKQKIDTFTYGFEPGFQLIDASGHLCPDCHHPSSLEDLVGGANTAQRFGCHPKDIKDPQVWSALALWLAYGLTNITALWSPHIIVLGGPMMKDIPLDQIVKNTNRLTSFVPTPPVIKLADLADDRAFYGALALLSNSAK